MKKIIIGLVSPTDIEDRRASSGTIFKIAHTLEGLGYEVRWIKVRYNNMSDKINRYVNKLSKCMIDLDFASSNRLKFAKHASSSIDITEFDQCDLLFFPFQSNALFGLKFDKSVIYLSDATFEVMVDYYIKDLKDAEIKVGNEIERYAMDHSNAIILSSDWAANSAIDFYNQSPSKVHVIEFGANIDDRDIIRKEYSYTGQFTIQVRQLLSSRGGWRYQHQG